MISNLAKQILRRSTHVNKVISLINLPQRYVFSSIDKVMKAQANVVKAIERESKYESETYEQDPQIQEFLNEHQLVFKESKHSLSMELHKDIRDYKLQIVFDTRPPKTGSMSDDNEDTESTKQGQQTEFQKSIKDKYDDDEEVETKPIEDFCNFVVYIVNIEGKCVAYDCTTFESKVRDKKRINKYYVFISRNCVDNYQIQINCVSAVDDIEAHKASTQLDRMHSRYNGPDFITLDQTAMLEFLQTIGVTEEVAAFIDHLSLDKEQRLYMRWLETVKNFLS